MKVALKSADSPNLRPQSQTLIIRGDKIITRLGPFVSGWSVAEPGQVVGVDPEHGEVRGVGRGP